MCPPLTLKPWCVQWKFRRSERTGLSRFPIDQGFAWLENYDEVDQHVRSVDDQPRGDVRALAQALCRPFEGERYRARALFSWLAFVCRMRLVA